MEAALNSPFGQTVLGPRGVTIGRSPDNQIVLNDPQASSHHAEVHPEGEGYVISDLGSTNGTFVNQQRLTSNVPYTLKPADLVRIGSTEFTYSANDNQQDDATVANSPGEWNASSYAPTVGIAPAAYPPNYNPGAPAYPPPVNYPQQGYQQPPANSPQQGYPPSPPNYPNYDTPPQQSYAPPVQPGQFNQPGQPGITAPGQPVQPARKSRLGLWIALLVLAFVIIAGAVGAYLYVNRSTPDKTLTAYCTAIKNGDAQGAYDQLSTRAKSKTSVAQISQALQIINSPLIGGIKDCTFSNVQENGSTATATVTITPNKGKALNAPAQLLDENGTWKVDNTIQGSPQ